MKEFLIVFILALIITPIIATLNIFNLPQEQSENSPPKVFDTVRKITANTGITGCRTKESYEEFAKFSAEKNSAAMKESIDEGLCIYFSSGMELLTQQDACKDKKADDVFAFTVKGGTKTEFFLPCFAIR